MNVKTKVTTCAVALSVSLSVYLFVLHPLKKEGETPKTPSDYLAGKRNNGFIGRDISFVYGNKSSSNLHVHGSVDLIRRDFPKIGPFKINMSRTVVLEGVDLHVNKNTEPPEELLKKHLRQLVPNLNGPKLLIKELTITDTEGKKTYETFEP
ncbi:MAG: hypothetical protein ACFHW5_18410 [Verrucomicrobiota bacterium]